MYAYYGLHRLVDARRGVWTGGLASPSVSQLKGSQEWALDPLGNWSSVGTDLDGAGGIDSDETETRDHRDPSLTPPTNRVNELYARELAPDTGGGTVDLAYDYAGNLLRQQLQSGGALRYTHDAWNRLVKVEFEDAEEELHPRAEYEYNPLNWRTVERTDTNTADSTHALDEMRVHLYDASWRLLESRIDSDFDPEETSPDFEEHTQLVWGLRYIDDIVSTRRDLNPSEDDGAEVRMFHATDAQFSSVAVLLDNGSLLERVAYSPYGVARHQWRTDVNGDGAVGAADLAVLLSSFGAITTGNYTSEADLDRNGVVNSADLTILLGYYSLAALPEGTLSAPAVANRTGYCGYRFAPETEMYLARNRWNSPPLGRWIQRDPLGYVDGMGLYEYVRGRPIDGSDPMGLDDWWRDPLMRPPSPFDGTNLRYHLEISRLRETWRDLAEARSAIDALTRWMSDHRDDPNRGCGIVVRRNAFFYTGRGFGHEWIEMPELRSRKFAGRAPAPDVHANSGRHGLGLYPADSLLDGEAYWYSPAGPTGVRTGGCRCTGLNDPRTGELSDETLEVIPVWSPVEVPAHLPGFYRGTRVVYVAPPLQFGAGRGKSLGSAIDPPTCDEIRECLLAYIPTSRYGLLWNNCRSEVAKALAACGLRLK